MLRLAIAGALSLVCTLSLAQVGPGPQPQPAFSGGTLSQPLILTPSTTGSSGLNVAPGTAPTAPNAGDLWATSTGLFARFGGVTTGPITGAAGSTGQLQTNNSGALAGITLGGDCTFSTPNVSCTKTAGVPFAASATTDATNASNISSGSLANARLATMAADTVKGSIAGGTPIDLTQTQLTSLCNTVTNGLSGCVPAFPNNTATFFRGDGTYATPPTVTSGAAGYVPAFPNNTTTFFRGDGTYATPPASMALLNTLTANNSATLSDTTSLTNSFHTYMVVVTDIIPVTNGVTFFTQVSTNGGSSYLNSGYLAILFNQVSGGNGGATSTTQINLSHTGQLLQNTAGEGLSGTFYIYNPAGGANRTHFSGQTVYESAAGQSIQFFGGWQDSGNTAVNAIQFAMTSGNISSGTIRIYGIP